LGPFDAYIRNRDKGLLLLERGVHVNASTRRKKMPSVRNGRPRKM